MEIDLRSDTVTRPEEGMWDAMNRAPVGDDVFGEDPGINDLESKVPPMFGKEAGLFVPSGTMGNQLAIKVLTRPADEVILDEHAHIFHSEGAAAGLISGVQLLPLRGRHGIMDADQIAAAIRPGNHWDPRTRLIALENTSNMGGGTCYPLQTLQQICNVARNHDLSIHMDGARIWNASVATGTPLESYGKVCDTLSVCFSKGLGAPVGSMLMGTRQLVDQARRYRKLLGGGMRQAGMLAAAASYAIDHHLPKLPSDHEKAGIMAESIHESPAFSLEGRKVETNIVLFEVIAGSVKRALDYFAHLGICMIPFGGKTIRATFHLQIKNRDMPHIVNAIKNYHPSVVHQGESD